MDAQENDKVAKEILLAYTMVMLKTISFPWSHKFPPYM
jgi:hypothetical protein